MTSRRNFLKGAALGASLVIPAPGKAVVNVKEHTEHKFVVHDHFLTKGDGTNEGDLAMLKVDGKYQNHVLTKGKWRRMFID